MKFQNNFCFLITFQISFILSNLKFKVFYKTALYTAIEKGNQYVAQILLSQKDIDINLKSISIEFNSYRFTNYFFFK